MLLNWHCIFSQLSQHESTTSTSPPSWSCDLDTRQVEELQLYSSHEESLELINQRIMGPLHITILNWLVIKKSNTGTGLPHNYFLPQ